MIRIICMIILSLFPNDIPLKNEKVVVNNFVESEKEIMSLQIPSIDFYGKIYDKKSELNNIDKNIILLDDSDLPSDENGIVLIGGHSGIGKYAYFKNLNKVKIGDYFIINYLNHKYFYEVSSYYLERKDGDIRVNNYNDVNKLIVYTCNPNDKYNYLVIVSNLLKKE